MITDGVQMAMAWSQLVAGTPVVRRRVVEAVERVDRESEGSGEQAGSVGTGDAGERTAEKAGHGTTMHFVYHRVMENGRHVAKRRPQLADSRYWCWMFDKAG